MINVIMDTFFIEVGCSKAAKYKDLYNETVRSQILATIRELRYAFANNRSVVVNDERYAVNEYDVPVVFVNYIKGGKVFLTPSSYPTAMPLYQETSDSQDHVVSTDVVTPEALDTIFERLKSVGCPIALSRIERNDFVNVLEMAAIPIDGNWRVVGGAGYSAIEVATFDCDFSAVSSLSSTLKLTNSVTQEEVVAWVRERLTSSTAVASEPSKEAKE